MKNEIPSFLLSKPRRYGTSRTGTTARTPFLDKGIKRFADLIGDTYLQWETANRGGLLQKLDARVKVFFLLLFVVIVSVKRTILPQITIGLFIFVLVAASRLNLLSFYRRTFFFGFVFGFLVALPSCLNIIAGGDMLVPLVHLSKPYRFWVYEVPQTIGITRQGLVGVIMLTLRVINSLSLSFLVISTTPFHEIIRALKSLRVPDTFLMIITLSYKYILIFARTVEDIHYAKKSKCIDEDAAQARGWIAGRMAFLLHKTKGRCEDVYSAMLARGFTGDIVLYGKGKLSGKDVAAGAVVAVAAVVMGIL